MAKPAPRGSALSTWAKEEMTNDAKFKANLKLLRALAVFFGGVVVFRSFGEALFAV